MAQRPEAEEKEEKNHGNYRKRAGLQEENVSGWLV